MKVIICLDDNNGVIFNHRRQSKDKAVIKDIIDNLGNCKLYIDDYSKDLFEDYNSYFLLTRSPNSISDKDYYFNEIHRLSDMQISTLVVYRWNRVYPFDTKADIDFSQCKLQSSVDFKGNSHEKITKEIYTK